MGEATDVLSCSEVLNSAVRLLGTALPCVCVCVLSMVRDAHWNLQDWLKLMPLTWT